MSTTFHRMAASQQPGKGKVVVGKSEKEKQQEKKTGVKITAAIFFDGTGNNLNNTTQRLIAQKKIAAAGLTNTGSYQRYGHDKDKGASYQSFYSNVALLSLMNTKTKLANREVSVYIEGIGTEDNQGDDTYGNAYGSGPTGVTSKVNREKRLGALTDGGIEKLVKKVRKAYDKGNEYIEQLKIHVYGFSRGAAAARHFIARKAAMCQKLGVDSKVVEYQFVGLFDTVSSFEPEGKTGTDTFGVYATAASHDFDNDVKELGLALYPSRDQIKKVVHLVAGNEYRANFSSTTIKSAIAGGVGYELVLPGAHSHIGGGYGEIEKESRELDGAIHMQELIAAGWYSKQHIQVKQELVPDYRESMSPRYRTIYFGVRTLSNKFQYIPLAAMIQLAAKHGTAFSESLLREGISLAVPTDLGSVKAGLVKYAIDNDGAHRKEFRFRSMVETHDVRRKYLHRSDSIGLFADGRKGMNTRKKNGKPTRQTIDG